MQEFDEKQLRLAREAVWRDREVVGAALVCEEVACNERAQLVLAIARWEPITFLCWLLLGSEPQW